jgi:diadenosine tetraphosphate (Ap4A) HIT family hydrolase
MIESPFILSPITWQGWYISRSPSLVENYYKATTMNNYEKHWHKLNDRLRAIESQTGDLRAVFAALNEHQIETGFLRNGQNAVERFSFCHPEFGSRCLRIQYNPSRAKRFRGAGIQTPPEQVASLHDGCFLCPDNIEWQQQCRQYGYDLEINGRQFIAWMNPFPILPGNLVVASREHTGQEWSLYPGGQREPAQIIADIVDLVARAPGYAGFYNGVNAGASNPGHLHYQLIRPPQGHGPFPLEVEAVAARSEQQGNSRWRLGSYPLESMHWHGAPGAIIENAADWVSRWADRQAEPESLTANIVAISDGHGPEVSLFFVPRDRQKSQAGGFAGKVGGLEVLGELIFTTSEEQEMLESGQLNYFSLEKVLSKVGAPINML